MAVDKGATVWMKILAVGELFLRSLIDEVVSEYATLLVRFYFLTNRS